MDLTHTADTGSAPRIRAIVLSVLGPAADLERLDTDTDLWQAGLDSLGSVALMVELEEEFGIEFPDELLTRETFSTLNRIGASIDGLTGR
ncbi:phosphopantetheine-binding protein (plasmid) [Streptomyces sp. HUAS TT11]|uniref:phosphopantetheine-binding protein n=1 Tax=Streptomyces sp. HUAS TT11 TaxID=3447508 RepID=UPI003F6558A1